MYFDHRSVGVETESSRCHIVVVASVRQCKGEVKELQSSVCLFVCVGRLRCRDTQLRRQYRNLWINNIFISSREGSSDCLHITTTQRGDLVKLSSLPRKHRIRQSILTSHVSNCFSLRKSLSLMGFHRV